MLALGTGPLKFGSWTFDMAQVDLQHVSQLNESSGGVGGAGSDWTRDGVRMGLLVYSVEWALLGVEGERHQTSYECCPGVYYPELVRAT